MNENVLISRRQFAAAAAVASAAIVPRRALARSGETPPSEKLNVAVIGVGGRGASVISAVAPEVNMVALCDVDQNRAAKTFAAFPAARQFRDFRKMFDALESRIDAVIVATPDHFHAVAAMAAIKRGKHVYCEKPLAHNVFEVRALMKAAREHGVVTQLGNQGHSSDSIRTFCEWIWDGAIGNVHTIHAGCAAVNSAIGLLPQLQQTYEVPTTLDWDLWLGPAAERYCPTYLPRLHGNGWVPFGNGTVGDWTCHVVDPVFWAARTRRANHPGGGEGLRPETKATPSPRAKLSPTSSRPRPAAASSPCIGTAAWSGFLGPPTPSRNVNRSRPVGRPRRQRDGHTTAPTALRRADHPRGQDKRYQPPEKTLPRVRGHHQDWLDAIRNGGKAGSDFAYGGPLTEIAMLGVVAIKLPEPETPVGHRRHAVHQLGSRPPRQSAYRQGWTL